MKKFVLAAVVMLLGIAGHAQNQSHSSMMPVNHVLPDIKDYVHTAQAHLQLYLDGQPNDVNSIVKEIETGIDSAKTRNYNSELLSKYFAPLRHFFLTTTNKTSVAAEFLYTGAPFSFCWYNDTALALCINAVKDGEQYNLTKTTEKRAAQLAMTNCLLPSLAALDEFKGTDIKYVALSVYYGCKDTRDGAPKNGVTPYCLTLVARLSDVQQYAAGLITAKGLLANAEVYTSEP